MTGRLVDMSFSLNRKQRITLEVDSDFRSLWDKLNQEPLLDIEIKKHRNKRSHSANAYFHVLVNKIAAETGESDDLVKERLVVAYGTVARDKDGCTVGFKLPVSVYDIGNFVLDLMLAVHPELITKQEDTDAE